MLTTTMSASCRAGFSINCVSYMACGGRAPRKLAIVSRTFAQTATSRAIRVDTRKDKSDAGSHKRRIEKGVKTTRPEHEHAVISTFDLFSIGGAHLVSCLKFLKKFMGCLQSARAARIL